MHIIVKLALLVILGVALFASTCRAEDVTLTWNNPTEIVESVTAGPYENPAGTRIWQLVADIADPDITTVTLLGYEPGTYTFVATSYDTEGVSSDRISGESEKIVEKMVVTNGTAFIMARVTNAIVLLVAGTVPIDTECIVEQTINGLYAVPASTFIPTTDADPVLVLAECS